jgi:hypothetical protein
MTYDEEQIARLLRSLPPAPEAWVEAANSLPSVRRELDTLVEQAESDAAYRVQLLADLDAALRTAGVEPRPEVIEHLRRRLEA